MTLLLHTQVKCMTPCFDPGSQAFECVEGTLMSGVRSSSSRKSWSLRLRAAFSSARFLRSRSFMCSTNISSRSTEAMACAHRLSIIVQVSPYIAESRDLHVMTPCSLISDTSAALQPAHNALPEVDSLFKMQPNSQEQSSTAETACQAQLCTSRQSRFTAVWLKLSRKFCA